MHHTPKGQNKKPQVLTAVSVAVGIAVFMTAPLLPKGQAILQAVSFALFALGLYYTLRYLMTSFSYAVEPSDGAGGEDLVVYKSQGRRVGITEARLSLVELSCFAPLTLGKIGKDVREKYPAMRVYDYTVTYQPNSAYLAVFVDAADNEIGVIFEPSAEMVGYMTKRA